MQDLEALRKDAEELQTSAVKSSVSACQILKMVERLEKESVLFSNNNKNDR